MESNQFIKFSGKKLDQQSDRHKGDYQGSEKREAADCLQGWCCTFSNIWFCQCTMGFHITFQTIEFFLLLQINIVTSIFIENCWNLFYMINKSQKIMPNIVLGQIWPIFAEIFTKNMKGSPANSEILCVNQIDRDLKKSRKQQFYLRTSSRCKYLPNICCHNIFQKIFGARLTWQDSTRPSTSFAWPL